MRRGMRSEGCAFEIFLHRLQILTLGSFLQQLLYHHSIVDTSITAGDVCIYSYNRGTNNLLCSIITQ